MIERLIEKDYQVCIVDPEGDYGTLRDVVALGNQWRAPSVNEIMSILEDPKVNLSINLLGVRLDEAHHMLPETWGPSAAALPRQLGETLLVTVHPEHIAPAMLGAIDVAIAIGPTPDRTLGSFARATRRTLPWPEALAYQPGHVVVWFAGAGEVPIQMQPQPGRTERIRHLRKYAEGDLRWNSFYFRGPEGRTNLKAQNLAIFSQIAAGIDEAT